MDSRAFAEAALRSLGPVPLRGREIVGAGAVNHVFRLVAREGEFVVRFARDPLDADDYAAEAWCLGAASAAGIPGPEVIGRGEIDGRSFLVLSFVEGPVADWAKTPATWERLGAYARRIAEIPLGPDAPDSLFPRFGRDPADNWRAHIEYNLAALHEDDPLRAAGVYAAEDAPRLRAMFEPLLGAIDRFGLKHGDLVPRNAIVAPDGALVVLDWGSAGTGPVPHDDCLRLLDDPEVAPEEVEAFATGFGFDLAGNRATLEAMRLLGRVDLCRWALDRRPDRVFDTFDRARRDIRRTFAAP